jgi:cyclopropane-fatty-acyl-phospholipid synthase
MVMLSSILKKNIEKGLSKIQVNKIQVTYPDKSTSVFGNSGSTVDLNINSWKMLWLAITRGDIGLAEGYFENHWSTSNLLELMEFFSLNVEYISEISDGKNIFKVFTYIYHLRNKNSISGSKKNILAHYDLGNSFYQKWLDSTMTYSSAFFDNKKMTLAEAQENKYQRIIDKLELKPGQSILEIGCGWGGFMEYASKKGFKVKGITISDEQHKFDAVVSIEMFEAVGKEYWNSYFSKVREVLNKNGKALIQTITIDDALFDKYARTTDFIQTYIFPGGLLASDGVFKSIANKFKLETLNTKSFAHDYAKTLEIWFHQFNDNWDEISKLGFNDRFKKLWDFYLAYCRGGFLSTRISVSQYLFEAK